MHRIHASLEPSCYNIEATETPQSHTCSCSGYRQNTYSKKPVFTRFSVKLPLEWANPAVLVRMY